MEIPEMTLKKMFLLALAIAILIPAVSNATVSRYMGLGGPGTNFIVYDASNPGMYPSLTHKYQKLWGIEYGGTGSAWDHTAVWGVWDFDEKCALKIVLDSSPSSMFNVNSIGVFDAPVDFDPQVTGIEHKFHMLNVVYGRPLGDDLDFGLGLRYEGKSFDSEGVTTATTDDLEASYSAFGLTFGITALEKKLDAALAIDFGGFSRDVAGETAIENDGSMRFSLQGRYWHKYSDAATLVPHLRFLSHKLGAEYTAGTTTTAASTTTTDLIIGLGHNWRPVENSLIIFELGFQTYAVEEDDGTNTETDGRCDNYWRAGAETVINGWLKGRLGAVRQWHSFMDEYNDGTNTFETTAGFSTTTIFCGGTFYYKRLFIDFLVQPDFLKYGPAFIGGENSAGLATKVSMFYNFKK